MVRRRIRCGVGVADRSTSSTVVSAFAFQASAVAPSSQRRPPVNDTVTSGAAGSGVAGLCGRYAIPWAGSRCAKSTASPAAFSTVTLLEGKWIEQFSMGFQVRVQRMGK